VTARAGTRRSLCHARDTPTRSGACRDAANGSSQARTVCGLLLGFATVSSTVGDASADCRISGSRCSSPPVGRCGVGRRFALELDGVTGPFLNPAPAPLGRGGSPEAPASPRVGSEPQPGAGLHHRRRARMDGRDDLLDVDSLQIQRGRGDIRMSQLALNDWQGDPPLGRARRRARAAAGAARTGVGRPRWRRAYGARRATADADQARPRVGPSITQNKGPTGSSTRLAIHASSSAHAHTSSPTSRLRPPFLTRALPRIGSRSLSVSDSASWIRSPPRQSTTISARSLRP
jgi:hypothetical protein